MDTMRLNKFLAHCGVCSRREADSLIDQGLVTVNGLKASAGIQVAETDEVLLRGKPVRRQDNSTVVLAYYKPVGVTCTSKDPHAKKTLSDVIDYPVRVTYAGRLDRDSEGLLLLTNNGDLIDGMMRGANRHEKEYIVKVDKEITEQFVTKMSGKIYLKELDATTRECEVEKLGKYTFKIVLTQGLNRQIRRMCQACGYQVQSLKRVRVLNVTLDKLKPGEYRKLKDAEVEEIVRAVARK